MRVLLRLLFIVLATPALLAAQPRGPGDLQILRDLAYGSHASHRLDAYLQPGVGPHPVVIFVHGGGHVSGDKRGGGLNLVLPVVAAAGYSVISINYRLAPAYPHPAQVEDARLAVRWVRTQAAQFRLDPARLAVAGASAGGHIVTFLGFTPCPSIPQAADPVGRQSCRPRTVINFFGTTDLRARNDRLLDALLGSNPSPVQKAEASPIIYVSADDPPTLSLHGTADPLVPYAQSVALHGVLRGAGVPNLLVTVQGGGHGSNWMTLPGAASWQRALVEWLDAHLKP